MHTCRATRSDAVSADLDSDIRRFFEQHSTNSTRKRDGNYGGRKGKREGTPKKFLDGSLKELHIIWERERISQGLSTVSYNEFRQRKPHHIVLRNKNDRIECACIRDVNMKFLVEAFHLFRTIQTQKGVQFLHQCSNHVSDLLAECTCTPTLGDGTEGDFLSTNNKCIGGSCDKCGTGVLDKYASVSMFMLIVFSTRVVRNVYVVPHETFIDGQEVPLDYCYVNHMRVCIP